MSNIADLLHRTTLERRDQRLGFPDRAVVTFPQGYQQDFEAHSKASKRIFHVREVVTVTWEPFFDQLTIHDHIKGTQQWWSDSALEYARRDHHLVRIVDRIIQDSGRWPTLADPSIVAEGYGLW